MARAPSRPAAVPPPLVLSRDDKVRVVGRLKRCIEELEAFDPNCLQQRNDPRVMALEARIADVLAAALGDGTDRHRRYSRASQLDKGGWSMVFGGHEPSQAQIAAEARRYVTNGKQEALALLNQLVANFEEELADESDRPAEIASGQRPAAAGNRKVFVIHGHDDGAREAVARFLERLDLMPVVLHEQASANRTIIEKIEHHSDVGFAVVLLTPDDMGRSASSEETLRPRARQNVILELGYFIGLLGRKHVCALRRGDVEIPSDFSGVVYVPFDNGRDWQMTLGGELQEAGYDIDWNKVMKG